MKELKSAYEDLLRAAVTVEKFMESGTTPPNKAAVDIMLELDAGLNAEIGTETSPAEIMAFKKVSVMILERCKRIDPERFAIPSQLQGL